MKKIILSIALCLYCIIAFGQNLTQEIEKVIQEKQASIGVAVMYGDCRQS